MGVKVGTLSGEARLAKEQQEFELKKMREQLEIQRANDEALYRLKAELDKEGKHAFSVVSGTYDESPEDDAGKYKTDRSDH